ncbi:cyclopropane fatty acyl phospholipid synthase [Candidatus Sulfidibacterium hydrothermale]|uniref:cyclopropane fatty acyl phospholipid synthase n=1 Tax=Candidatus Sulfidibacterium hydrothermale TaxID=2875962 RepID=UPI001F0AE821|nr:cyclopropane fatty acyl phospholipid synthase [Candidatus Sulfidibacterium hydrothermale]UBM62409.1 cyclopropane fatty acyl phospholipid synthase [Candidatus Sulfidibacterium hydrothermale]
MDAKDVVISLLEEAGITLNGSRPWDVQVHNENTFKRWISETELGLGESYMDGWWDVEALDEFFNKILRANLEQKIKHSLKTALFILSTRIFNYQTVSRSKQVGEEHYDLGNDLFRMMLDKRMVYSSAYWKKAKDLDEAQEVKLDLICKKLELKPGMKVLDIGCGWGSFARFAAEKYGVEVLGVSISKKQIELGKVLCKGLPVELRFQDYREVTGQFDAVLSIGFFEHVGYKNYRTYMEVVNRCLKNDGISLIHTIGSNVSVTYVNEWTHKYIFPNGMIPSLAQIAKAAEGLFVVEDVHNFGPDYDKTLMAWYANFEKAWPQLKDKYHERFYRMWRYFLLSSAGSFRSRFNQLWQVILTKPGRDLPQYRY